MKTILAIAISAAFCYSSYALANDDEIAAAVAVFDRTLDGNAEVCAELLTREGFEDIGLKECIVNLYNGAAVALMERAYDHGKADAECATKSREILTF